MPHAQQGTDTNWRQSDSEATVDVGELAEQAHMKRADATDSEPDSDAEPAGSRPRGVGDPLRVGSYEQSREICDGSGICSLGRCLPSRRPVAASQRIAMMRDLLFFHVDRIRQVIACDAKELFWRLAEGEIKECPFQADYAQRLQREVESIWADLQGGAHRREGDRPMAVHGRLLEEMLRSARDLDWRGMRRYHCGIRLCVGMKSPRTPAVFGRKRKCRLREQQDADAFLDEVEAVWRSNCKTVDAHAALIERQLIEHCSEALCLRLTPSEAHRRFPDLVVSSMGVICKVAEPEEPEDIRVLNDGTHGVPINRRIRWRLVRLHPRPLWIFQQRILVGPFGFSHIALHSPSGHAAAEAVDPLVGR